MTARFAARDGALAAAVREQQDLVARWRGLDAALVEVVARPPAERKPELEARLRD
jgi:hypothetical protein